MVSPDFWLWLPEAYLINSWLVGEECKPIIIRDADGAPQASPWHHLVSPIRFANGGT